MKSKLQDVWRSISALKGSLALKLQHLLLAISFLLLLPLPSWQKRQIFCEVPAAALLSLLALELGVCYYLTLAISYLVENSGQASQSLFKWRGIDWYLRETSALHGWRKDIYEAIMTLLRLCCKMKGR